MKTFPHKKWNPFVQLDRHAGVFMNGPIPVAGFAFHIAGGVLAFPWIYMGSQKYNDCKLFGDGLEIVSRGHEPKYLIIPHLNLFPFTPAQPNILIPLLLLGSSNKCQFAVGSIKCKDGAMAVSIFKYVGINQACMDPCSAPVSLTVNWGTINAGFTWGDLLATVLCFGFDALKSYLENKFFGWLGGKYLPKGLFKSQALALLGKAGIKKVFREANGKFASMAEKLVGEAVMGGIKAIYGEMFGGTAGGATGFDKIDPINWGSNKAQAGAERLGAWVDGRSELFGP